MEAPSTRSSRQEQRCHRVVWLISRFESSGVVLLVIPRGARRPVTGRGERPRERERERVSVRVERVCRKSGGVRTRGCAMRGRECRWRLVGETFGVDGGWWEEAPERVIESRARSLLYRPPYAAPFPLRCPRTRSATPATDGSRYFTPVCEPRRVLAHSASFLPPRLSLSSVLLLSFSLARTFELRASLCIYILASTARKTTTTTTATTTTRSRRAPSSTGDAPVKCVSACPKLMETSCRPSAHIPVRYQYHDG